MGFLDVCIPNRYLSGVLRLIRHVIVFVSRLPGARLASCQASEASRRDSDKERTRAYSTTCNFKLMEP